MVAWWTVAISYKNALLHYSALVNFLQNYLKLNPDSNLNPIGYFVVSN